MRAGVVAVVVTAACAVCTPSSPVSAGEPAAASSPVSAGVPAAASSPVSAGVPAVPSSPVAPDATRSGAPRRTAAPKLTGRPATSSGGATTALAAIAAMGLGAVLWRRRAGAGAGPAPRLEVLAQATLGGRARAVWLRAANRELVVAVTPQAVAVLSRWRTAAVDEPREPRRADRAAPTQSPTQVAPQRPTQVAPSPAATQPPTAWDRDGHDQSARRSRRRPCPRRSPLAAQAPRRPRRLR